MNKPTYEQIAKSYDLWGDYVDPHATMSKETFDALSTEVKVQMQIDMFGPEEEDVVCEMYYVASPDMSEDKFTAILQGYESLVDCQAARDLAKAA